MNLDFSKTLFVCTGNVFRSVIAEKFFIQEAVKTNLPFRAKSCGTDIYFKRPNSLLNKIIENKYTITLKNHIAKRLNIEDIKWASAVICFTPEHQKAILKMLPEAKNKTFLISQITSLDSNLFKDIDYYEVSEENRDLLMSIEAIKFAVSKMLSPSSLSIIIPVFNEEKSIANILTELLNQSSHFNVKEIIVVSSGSTDRTNEIIKQFYSPLITFIEEKGRNGKISAFKKAIPFIKGSYVLLVDGDIDIDSNFIKECFSCIFRDKTPATGRVVPVKGEGKFFNKISEISCKAWNDLRKKNDEKGEFIYPTGYAMIFNRDNFIETIKHIDNTTINDDALIALSLLKKKILFHYSDSLRVYVKFPQTFQDFFRQKIRTRMGRRQFDYCFFREIERKWRKEVISLINVENCFYALFLLFMDALARYIASVKIKFARNPHLWNPCVTTKVIYSAKKKIL